MDSMFDRLGSLLSDYIDNPDSQNENIRVKVFNFKQEDKEKLTEAMNESNDEKDSNGSESVNMRNKSKVQIPEEEKKGSYKILHGFKMPPKEYEKDFRVLGAEFGANLEECRSCYKKQLKKYHPDRFSNSPGDLEKATLITKEINASFERIKKWYEQN